MHWTPLSFCLLLLLPSGLLSAQSDNHAYLYVGMVYDDQFEPLPNTHVLAKGSGDADVTDSAGVFQLYVRDYDMLSFYNIACKDTSVYVSKNDRVFIIHMQRRYYPIREARIFPWGSTYGEFMEENKRLGVSESLQEKLDLPVADPGLVPFEMDEERIKSPGFLITSPVSYLYYNLSKKEQSVRKVYKLEKNSDRIAVFNGLVGKENLSVITGLSGSELEDFLIYLNQHMTSTYKNSELEILSEIYQLWAVYQTGHE